MYVVENAWKNITEKKEKRKNVKHDDWFSTTFFFPVVNEVGHDVKSKSSGSQVVASLSACNSFSCETFQFHNEPKNTKQHNTFKELTINLAILNVIEIQRWL